VTGCRSLVVTAGVAISGTVAVGPVEAEGVGGAMAAQTERSGVRRLCGFISQNSATDGAE